MCSRLPRGTRLSGKIQEDPMISEGSQLVERFLHESATGRRAISNRRASERQHARFASGINYPGIVLTQSNVLAHLAGADV